MVGGFALHSVFPTKFLTPILSFPRVCLEQSLFDYDKEEENR